MTERFLLGIVVALLAWEAYALMDPNDSVLTITAVITAWNSATGGLVALLLGILMGHFFFPQ